MAADGAEIERKMPSATEALGRGSDAQSSFSDSAVRLPRPTQGFSLGILQPSQPLFPRRIVLEISRIDSNASRKRYCRVKSHRRPKLRR